MESIQGLSWMLGCNTGVGMLERALRGLWDRRWWITYQTCSFAFICAKNVLCITQ